MANYRQIHVHIWKDEWFLDLEPDEKLLFIYFFSNENTNMAGIYKLAFKVICFETGLNEEFVKTTLTKFSEAEKVYYENGIVWVVNMRRHHETTSEKVQIGIRNDLALIPDCNLKRAYIDHEHRVSIGSPYRSLTRTRTEEEQNNNDGGGGENPPNVFRTYEQEIGPITEMISEELQSLEKEHPPVWIIASMKIAAINSKRSLGYCRAILNRWKSEGYGSEFKASKNTHKKSEPAGYAGIRAFLKSEGIDVNGN